MPAVLWLLPGMALLSSVPLPAQADAHATAGAPSPLAASAWVQTAADREVRIVEDDGGFPLSFRTRKVDARGDSTREVIESREGSVARLVERDGHPLTREQDQDERQRLLEVLAHPADFVRHHKRDASIRDYTVEMVRLFPRAMLVTYAPGQPQLGHDRAPQVVVDFAPNPGFRPPSMISELLTGIEGRIWIDERTGTIARAEGRVIRPVNFGWGVLARLYPGGTVALEQVPVGGDRWAYSRMENHLLIREVMVHNTEQNVHVSAWNFRLLPAPVGFQDAVRSLLAAAIPLLP